MHDVAVVADGVIGIDTALVVFNDPFPGYLARVLQFIRRNRQGGDGQRGGIDGKHGVAGDRLGIIVVRILYGHVHGVSTGAAHPVGDGVGGTRGGAGRSGHGLAVFIDDIVDGLGADAALNGNLPGRGGVDANLRLGRLHALDFEAGRRLDDHVAGRAHVGLAAHGIDHLALRHVRADIGQFDLPGRRGCGRGLDEAAVAVQRPVIGLGAVAARHGRGEGDAFTLLHNGDGGVHGGDHRRVAGHADKRRAHPAGIAVLVRSQNADFIVAGCGGSVIENVGSAGEGVDE